MSTGQSMKRITYLLIVVAAAATLLLGVTASSQPASAVGLGFLAWGVSPYLYLAAMNRWAKTRAAGKAVLVIAVLASLIGVWVLLDAMFLHPDAQSGLAFLFAPLWQWFLLLIATVPVYLFVRGAVPPDA